MSYRVISSRQTQAGWVVGPVLLVVGTVFFAGMFHLGWFPGIYRNMFPHELSPVFVNLFWGVWFLLWFLSLWWSFRLKRIAVDGDSIYVSDFLRSVKLPLSGILAITENRSIKAHPVTIEFAGATPWGHYVKFMPKIRFLVPHWISHPIVAELRDMVYWAKAGERMSDKLQQDSLTPEPELAREE
jgi:hypothetical protein